jgi:hypothetical protein
METQHKKIESGIIFNLLETALITLWGMLIGAFVSITITYLIVIEPMQEEAIERNYAEWKVVDNKTGDTKFTWK